MTDDFAFPVRDETLPTGWPAPELSPEERAIVERFENAGDVLAQEEATALRGLFYALYYSRSDEWPWWETAPQAVLAAYSEVQPFLIPHGGVA